MELSYSETLGWVVVDGLIRHEFGADEFAARRFLRENTMASVVSEWAELNRGLLDKAQEIIDATARPRRLGQANNIPAIIDATMPGEEVGDSGWSRERAAAVNAMWSSFEVWLSTPLEDAGGLAPVQILSMRD